METLISVLSDLDFNRKLSRLSTTTSTPNLDNEAIDLKDLIFHLRIHLEHTTYIQFAFQGKIYEFQVLPFGLSTAPRAFIRVVRALAVFLQQKGVEMFQYLDDWLINGETLAQTLWNRDLVYQWTVHLSFIVNKKKSD